jgi:hypothetical protein
MIKNRRIPKLAKKIFQRNSPNNVLMQELKEKPLAYKLKPNFVEKIELQEIPKNPTGFEFPDGVEEKLPFHVQRTTSGSLPVFIDYK